MSQITNMVPTLMVTFLMIGSLLSTNILIAQSVPNMIVQSQSCGNNTYAASDPYSSSIAYVLASLINVTPTQKVYDYYASSPYATSAAYGHATCNQTLANAYCAMCLVSAQSSLTNSCGLRTAGQVTMGDCSMSYQNSPYPHGTLNV